MLADKATEALKALIEKKRRAGRDVIQTDNEATKVDSEDEDQVDLLETIRQSLQHSRGSSGTRRQPVKQGNEERPRTRKDASSTWTKKKQPSRSRKGR